MNTATLVEAVHNPTTNPEMPGNVIPFPVREKPLATLREAVAELYSSELLRTAGRLIELANEAAGRSDDADFFDRTKAAFACLERVLQEGGRI